MLACLWLRPHYHVLHLFNACDLLAMLHSLLLVEADAVFFSYMMGPSQIRELMSHIW